VNGDEIFFPEREFSQRLDDKCPSHSTVKNWVAKFGRGHLNIEDKECSGRPIQVTVQKMWMQFIS
jgi:transposase